VEERYGMSHYRRIILDIEGMSCTGCETRIGNALMKIEGVTDVRVSYAAGTAGLAFDESLVSPDRIIDTIEKLDYKVINQRPDSECPKEDGNGSGAGTVTDKTNIMQLIGIGVILLSLYLIINNTVGFNFIPEIDQSMGLGLLFMVGLMTSLHCVAMCGGINLSVCPI